MDIFPLDLSFQGILNGTAAYLVVGPEGPVLVETGPASTLETLIARLAEHGYRPDDIRHVLVTHVHLDHAGAAGWWARQGARVYVHHAGAPHLVDPSRLLASAQRIYGDAMDTLWGKTLAAPAGQVCALHGGDEVRIRQLTFVALDTPGHARHHHVYRLDDVAFTGDAAGVRLPGSPLVTLPAPPPQFDLLTWKKTIGRLRAEDFSAIYPTHYGRLTNVREHLELVADLIDRSAEFVRVRMKAGLERGTLVKEYAAWIEERARSHAVSERDFVGYETTNPSAMSVDGIMRYWRKREAA